MHVVARQAYQSVLIVNHLLERRSALRAGQRVNTPKSPVGALEMHPLGLKFIEQVHQAFHAAPEPIQFPDHEGVGFAQLGQRLFQPGRFDLRAAEFVGENALASCFLERVQLHFQTLIMGRYPGVSDPQRLKFSLRHQILDTRVKDEETRKTNQEWLSGTQKRPFGSVRRRLNPFLVNEGFREPNYAASRTAHLSAA